jgi:hypothetical protein
MKKAMLIFSLLVLIVGSACTRNHDVPSATPDVNILATAKAAVALTDTAAVTPTLPATSTSIPQPTSTSAPTSTEDPFKATDVQSGVTYYQSVRDAVVSGSVLLKQQCKEHVIYSTGDIGSLYCPGDFVYRDEIAMSICRAIYDLDSLPAPTGTFDDRSLRRDLWTDDAGNKTPVYHLEACLEQMLRDGYTAGPSVPGGLFFIPERKVSFDEYWVFFLNGVHGGSWSPPSATGLYKNCPVGLWFSSWCESYINEGWYDLSKGPVDPGQPINRVDLARVIEQYLKHNK